VNNWLCHDLFYPINGVAYCQDDEKMQEVALEFSRASKGAINGCIVHWTDGWYKLERLWVAMEWRTVNHSTAGFFLPLMCKSSLTKESVCCSKVSSQEALSIIQPHSSLLHFVNC
jgi:hypothetical protein